MMVPPGCRAPDFSASSTMASAMRSLMEPPGLPRSDLIHTLAPAPNRRVIGTWGGFPIVCGLLSVLVGRPGVWGVVGGLGVGGGGGGKTGNYLWVCFVLSGVIMNW